MDLNQPWAVDTLETLAACLLAALLVTGLWWGFANLEVRRTFYRWFVIGWSKPKLKKAVRACRAALKDHARAETPKDWATIQNNLGITLSMLGGWEDGEAGKARLREAVLAFRAALEIHTRADMPKDWARTQHDLGIALSMLGEREDGETGKARLEEAILAFRSALEVRTRAGMPQDWARTQHDLGITLATLAGREDGEAAQAQLETAILAYRAALEVRTRADMPMDWVRTQNSLGLALTKLGIAVIRETELACRQNRSEHLASECADSIKDIELTLKGRRSVERADRFRRNLSVIDFGG